VLRNLRGPWPFGLTISFGSVLILRTDSAEGRAVEVSEPRGGRLTGGHRWRDFVRALSELGHRLDFSTRRMCSADVTPVRGAFPRI